MAILIKDQSQLKARNVRLILPTGNVIIDKIEALNRATADGIDLFLVQDGDLPVVKFCDYAKIEYDKQKNIKHNKPKKSKQVHIGPHTQQYDLQRFAQQATEFINEGHSVSVRMEVRGRDRSFVDLIKQKMAEFVGMVVGAKPGRLVRSDDGQFYTQSLN